jgi:hypothetical protein
MRDRGLTGSGRRLGALVLVGAVCLSATGCGGGDPGASAEPGAPVGRPVLPDLSPKPQLNVIVQRVGAKWRIRFDTVLVNVGKGDFILRATRMVGATWHAEQDIPYSGSGARRVSVPARLVWGGDGHNHWHIARIAAVELVPLDAKRRPVRSSPSLADHKAGFCFYDHTHELPRGRGEATYSAKSCGKRDAVVVGMGLSEGWNDTYTMDLPGQSIDVTQLPNGNYRLYTVVDEQRWFREASRKNNRTWIDIKLFKTANGLAASTIGTGPTPK